MKEKLSISMDEKTVTAVEKELDKGIFRNKSHLIEYAVSDYLRRKDD